MTDTDDSSMAPTAGSGFGVLYMVDDNPAFRHMMDMSIASLKRFHPDWPIHVAEVPSYAVPLWKKVYRAVSFWKWQARRDRAGQDIRIVAAKSEAMLNSPFETTFWLDVDTIVTAPLDEFRRQGENADLVMTPLPWKRYHRTADWQPESWPYWMAGVAVYGPAFKEVYRRYFYDRFDGQVAHLLTTDQFVVSLICEVEKDNLKIVPAPNLQMDVMNIEHHFGTNDYPRVGEHLDLRWERLKEFHVFHYNEYKPQYMAQIRDVWGLS